ncbi:hypothetical protein H8A99_14100 [Bradyrhizobium sp. Arg68]|uniref:hypothetical protein n=1 Tax=Bradyrhizobium ivorense TaxID=2511166 RepID=UPI001E3126C4|nr:hypothetical protein [Bradyrhizobium ivorense]MCC8937573.1 hypothetical protein [Bradyrhizobium ivorense]
MPKEPEIHPDDFPIGADGKEIKTNKGKPIATGKDKAVAEEVAERLNEQAYREEHDRWSA